ncbi:TonB-dependent receptor [Zhongshania arctica]|uniref:TonB-dependent receptor n=1 Tax=Zhongshania arctica TaxID=3238302 RepID=A0ABV3U0V0_9GAMM
MKSISRSRMACAIGIAVLGTPSAYAVNNLALEEVVVTAQKREQSAMTVPVTVDTFTNQDLENTGALNMEDIQAYIPGLKVGDGVRGGGSTQSSFVIRGIDSSNISTGGDPSVATFLDGVYLPRAAITVPFSDMQRVEVLKGPQGTLFGRNAAAGVVSFIPNAPSTEETEGFVMTKLGSYNLFRVEGMGNLPLADNLALRLNLLHNQRDAVIDSKGPAAPDPGEQDNQFGRVALRWDTNDRLSMQFAYDIDRVDNGPQARLSISEEFSNFPDPTDRTLETDAMGGGETREMQGFTGKLWYDLTDTTSMTLIGSYRAFETYNLQDEDATADDSVYVDTNNIEDSDIAYFEMQFNVALPWVDAVFGANYSKEDTYQQTALTFSYGAVLELASGMAGIPQGLLNTLLGGAVAGRYVTERMTNEGDFESYGFFSDLDFPITERLNIITGLRYSNDQKSFSWDAPLTDFVVSQALGENFFFNSDGVETASESWDKITGRLVANYQITDGAMTFLSYSTGYKSGGYDSLNTGTREAPLDPEVVSNIEFGVKGDFFDTRVRTQVALFKMIIDDRQEAIESRSPDSNGAVPTVINTDEDIQGVELTADWLATENLRFGLIYTYREQESSRESYFNAQGEFVVADQLNATSPQEYTVTLDWSPEINYGLLLFHFDYIYEENTEPENEDHQPFFNTVNGYGDDTSLLNARVAWNTPGGGYEMALWGKNLLGNERVSQPGGLTGTDIGTFHVGIVDPLTYGVDFRVIF